MSGNGRPDAVVRDGREDAYVLTPADRRRLAKKLATDEARCRARDEWLKERGEGAALPSLRDALYRKALAGLAHELDAAETSAERTRAAQLVIEHELECQRLQFEMNVPQPRSVHTQPSAAEPGAPPGVVITQEQAVEILKQRRLRLAGGV